MARRPIIQRIALEGGTAIRSELAQLGDAGRKAFETLSRHAKQLEVASKGLNGNLLELRNRFTAVQDAAGRIGQRFQFLGNETARLAGTIAGVFSVRAISEISDQYTELYNTLRVVAGAQGDVNETIEELAGIANRTRAPLEAIATLYQRVSIAGTELGVNQQDILRFTENVGLALAQQGGSAQQASGALLQLSQALGGGVVRAEEFNSILEGAYPIALAAAQGLDAAGGSVARLRQLVLEGSVTSQDFFRAILSQSDALEAAFSTTIPTISQSFTVLRNNFILWVGQANEGVGVAGALAQAVLWVANNFDLVATAVLGFIGVWGAYKALSVVSDMIALGRALLALIPPLIAVGATLLANPMTLWLVGIVAATTALMYLTGTLDDFVEGVGGLLNPILDAMGAMLGFGKESENALGEVNEETGNTLEGLMRIGTDGSSAMGEVSSAIMSTAESAAVLNSELASVLASIQQINRTGRDGGGGGGASVNAPGFSGGGPVTGPGSGTSDSILARLSNGEFVMRAAAVRRFGVGFMNAINNLRLPAFSMGGLVEGLSTGMLVSPNINLPSTLGALSGTGRPLSLTIGGETFDGLIAPEDVADRLTRYSMSRQVRSAGRKPNWYGGK